MTGTTHTHNHPATADADRRHKSEGVLPRLGLWLGGWGGYLAVAVAACALVVIWGRVWTFPPGGLLANSADATWMQAMFVIHGETGVFGVSEHIAWPGGGSAWSYPQLGAFAGLFAWISVGWFGMAPATALWWWVAASAGLNAIGMLWFLRSLVGARFQLLVLTLAATFGAAVYSIGLVYHANLTLWVVLPYVFALLIRWDALSHRKRWVGLAILAVIAATSPLWWVVVAALMVGVMAVGDLITRNWRRLALYGATVVCLFGGIALQGALRMLAGGDLPADELERPTRQSIDFAGRLLDLPLSSPLVNHLFPYPKEVLEQDVVPIVTIGTVGGIAAIVVAGVVLWPLPRRSGPAVTLSVLLRGSAAALLFFLMGGLGHVQAGLALLAGTESPARVWLRMGHVMALLGAGWFVFWLRRRQKRRPGRLTSTPAAAIMAGAVGLLWVLDVVLIPKLVPVSPDSRPQSAAVQFLRARLAPCPVAQLPVDSVPNRFFRGLELGYQGFVPFILAPEFFWSYGSHPVPGVVNTLPATVGPSEFAALKAAGYCAVLYDKELVAAAGQRELEGKIIDEQVGAPDLRTPRFDVYLLDD